MSNLDIFLQRMISNSKDWPPTLKEHFTVSNRFKVPQRQNLQKGDFFYLGKHELLVKVSLRQLHKAPVSMTILQLTPVM